MENKANGKKQDPRHQKRVKLMQALFAYSFKQVADPQIEEIIKQLAEIDKEIEQIAPERPLKEMAKTDLAILRLIIAQAKQNKTPPKVLIDEAIELAKEFGSENSPQFINGALSKYLKLK